VVRRELAGAPRIEVAGVSKEKVEELSWDTITQVRAELAGHTQEISSPLHVTSGTKWVWRFDFATLVGHDGWMDARALERLGHHVVSRRVALGFRTRIDLASSLQFTVRTLSDIEHGVRKASPGTYAMLENKLAWAPGSIETILAGGEPTEVASTLHKSSPTTRAQGYALRPTNPHALSQIPTEELLLELRRRIIAPRNRRDESWDDWDDGLDPHGDGPQQG
jgi:hypothetical protein